jgi:hypothetical protein
MKDYFAAGAASSAFFSAFLAFFSAFSAFISFFSAFAGSAAGAGAGVASFFFSGSPAIADVQNKKTNAIAHTMKRFILIPPLSVVLLVPSPLDG